jgi:hypothetical protein
MVGFGGCSGVFTSGTNSGNANLVGINSVQVLEVVDNGVNVADALIRGRLG